MLLIRRGQRSLFLHVSHTLAVLTLVELSMHCTQHSADDFAAFAFDNTITVAYAAKAIRAILKALSATNSCNGILLPLKFVQYFNIFFIYFVHVSIREWL